MSSLALCNESAAETIAALKEKRELCLDEKISPTIIVGKTRRLSGEIEAPPSKSYSHRALMVAALCPGEVVVENPLLSDDIFATIQAWGALGAHMHCDKYENRVHIEGVTRPFLNSEVPPSIFVKESGTTLRFLLPGLAFANGKIKVKGQRSLEDRPNVSIVKSLRQLGIAVEGKGQSSTVPITVQGKGFLPAGDITISGESSSQVVSAFLLWLPLASSPRMNIFSRFLAPNREHASLVRVEGRLVSKPYVDVTIDVLRWAGIKIDELEPGSLYRVPSGQHFKPSSPSFQVNGDYSSAAFVLVAACLTDSNVLVRGLKQDKQGDRAIVRILKEMGANIEEAFGGIRVTGPASLRGLELDCSDIPDLVPILCVLGVFAEGRTVLKNIAHLRYKETDRLKGPTEELTRLGALIEHTDNSITIYRSRLVSNRVNARGDHRLAMSLTVAALAGEGAEIDGAPSIKKSYPWFIRDMRSLGADIRS